MTAGKQALWPLWMSVACLAMTAGCESQDADRLNRLGTKVLDKLQDPPSLSAVGGPASPLQSIRGSWNDLALDTRVSARLRWDKDLAGASIQVNSAGQGQIRLRGTVASMDVRQKAVALARNTVGVTNVQDELETEAKP